MFVLCSIFKLIIQYVVVLTVLMFFYCLICYWFSSIPPKIDALYVPAVKSGHYNKFGNMAKVKREKGGGGEVVTFLEKIISHLFHFNTVTWAFLCNSVLFHIWFKAKKREISKWKKCPKFHSNFTLVHDCVTWVMSHLIQC